MTGLHSHSVSDHSASQRRMALALVITLAFVFLEGAAGFWANSLALLTDAAHNITDVIALALSWFALRLLSRPSSQRKTYGYHRVGIVVALANSISLVLIALFVFYEALERLRNPLPVQEGVLIVVAVIAFFVNAGTAWLVHRGSEHDLNQRSAFLHLAGDAVSTLGALVAGIGIALTGWQWLDPAASVLIGLLILYNVLGIVRESLEILLEWTPRGLNMDKMVRDLRGIQGVRGIHDLHVWSLSQSLRALSAHVLTDDMSISEGAAVQREINCVLHEKYGIAHATLQLEAHGCEPDLLYCELHPNDHDHDHQHREKIPKKSW